MKMLLKITALCIAGLVSAVHSHAQQGTSSPRLSTKEAVARLQSDIPRLMKEANVPGMSVALVRDGKLAWAGVYGVMNNDTKQPVTKRSIFEANSLSKPVFAYAVMTLVDQGKFDLDKPIASYMDSGFYDKACNDPRLKQVTGRLILSNSGGIGYSSDDPDNKFTIEFNPGEKFKYSPTGFQVLSHIIEKITDMRLEDFMDKAILTPLHMDQSSYIWLDKYDSLRVYQHNWQGIPDTGRGKWKRGAACCSLQTNAEDYSKLVIAVMNGELLKKSTWDDVMKPQINMNVRFTNLFWGLGWGLEKTKNCECFWHWGDGGKSKDYIAANLSTKDAIVFFADSENGLSFAKELLDDGIGGEHPGLAFLNYQRYDDPSVVLLKSILAEGAPIAMKDYLSERKQKVDEVQMNIMGYQLLGIKKLDDAYEVLKQNTVDYPNSSNTWDSFAEICMDKGDKASAIKYYKKSLELDPKNTNAIDQLKKLEQ
jgi:CubicO group peptidase (beta-lactamase class C family)